MREADVGGGEGTGAGTGDAHGLLVAFAGGELGAGGDRRAAVDVEAGNLAELVDEGLPDVERVDGRRGGGAVDGGDVLADVGVDKGGGFDGGGVDDVERELEGGLVADAAEVEPELLDAVGGREAE